MNLRPITFGGFMGLLSFLALFFRDQYALTNVQAGGFATVCALTGSMIRPLGGYLSDRYGGIRELTWLYLGVAAALDHSFSIFIPAAVDARPGKLRGHRGRLKFEHLPPARHDQVGANGQACEPQQDVVMTEL
jgi:MFS family permease